MALRAAAVTRVAPPADTRHVRMGVTVGIRGGRMAATAPLADQGMVLVHTGLMAAAAGIPLCTAQVEATTAALAEVSTVAEAEGFMVVEGRTAEAVVRMVEEAGTAN